MSLTADAIEALAKMADGTVNEYNGVLFHLNHNKETPLTYPTPDTVKLFSLTQVLTYLGPLTKSLMTELPKLTAPGDVPSSESGAISVDSESSLASRLQLEAALDGRLVINVIDHETVEIFNEKPDANNDLRVIARASFANMFDKFTQGRYQDQEAFIIDLMSKFEETPARQELLKIVGYVKSGETTTNEDDGFSQNVEMKAGVTLVKEQTLKNLWKLRPFKTFPEIEQPEVNYILRVQKGSDTPRFALFEADGGMWKVATTKKVREWFVNAVKPALSTDADKVVIL